MSMINYWLDRAAAIIEQEVILVKIAPETKNWYDKMPSVLPIIYPGIEKPRQPSEFGPKVGIAHHLRYTRYGIEAVVKAPRKYHKLSYYVLHDKINHPGEPFWVVVYKKMI
jgi:hypothetical protein